MLRQYELVERVRAYNPDTNEALLNRAYVFTTQKHGSQKRDSGDPYYSHPIEVAGILTQLKLDDETIVTGMLHDTLEDTLTTSDEIAKLFGDNIARLVEGVTKLSKIEAMSENERAAENMRKFLLAMSHDVRVLLVKLADRLHNMRTLHFITNEQRRRRIARETMDIYAPLSERIGMYSFMSEMHTLAFAQLEPEAYDSITKRMATLSLASTRVARITSTLTATLKKAGIEAQVYGRLKHPYSVWKKMAEKHISFEQLSDVMGFRAIVADTQSCYQALGVIHSKWPMVPGRFKDYISTPKRNGYRSLHSSIIHSTKMRVEVQIRSQEMHTQAEYGLAAHWSYKQKEPISPAHASWMNDLIEIMEHAASAEEVLEHTRMAMYQDRIFAFTPKGELIQMPKGASTIDFAYAVHTVLGDQAVGAKVNGRVVPLRTLLENGDQVEILTSKAQEPQPHWLNFALTGKASAAIRRHVRLKEQEERIALGRKLFQDILSRLPLKFSKSAFPDALKRLKVASEEELMLAIALGKLRDRDVLQAIFPAHDMKDIAPALRRSHLSIKGLTPGMAFTLAQCCHPVPGDRIVGIRKPDAPLNVHLIECASLAKETESDWLDLGWEQGATGSIARIEVGVRNMPGSLAAVAGVIGSYNSNIIDLRIQQRDSDFHAYSLDIEVRDRQAVSSILASLRALESVGQAERV
jgi:GTP diphosphokinase / guanosine-3',5'-bis(diphosphate) 3'-diphosphatase